MELSNQILSYLNSNPPVVIGIGGLLAVVVQYAINRYTSLGKLSNYLLGVAALPGAAAAVAALTTTMHFSAYPWFAVAGQLFYALYEAMKRNAVKAVTKAEATDQVAPQY